MARDGIYDRWLELHNWLTDEGASDRVLELVVGRLVGGRSRHAIVES